MIFRVNKTDNYTVISNYHLRDKRLSLKAKGLLTMMLSLRDDWDYSIAGLCSICKESECAIKSGLSELKEYGYLVVTKINPSQSNGRYSYVYDVYENPKNEETPVKQEGGFQPLEVQPLEVQPLENQGQLNTKVLNTNKLNTDNKWRRPSRDEVRSYFIEKNFSIDPDYFYDYYESVNWYRGKTKMKNWKMTANNWNAKERNTSEYDQLF